MLDQTVCVQDLEDVDKTYYSNLVWMLENTILNLIDYNFSIEIEQFGRNQT